MSLTLRLILTTSASFTPISSDGEIDNSVFEIQLCASFQDVALKKSSSYLHHASIYI